MNHEQPLGWRIGPADSRDLPLRLTLERRMAEPEARQYGSRFWYSPSTLNQWTGSCVGHGGIHVYNSSPKVHRLTDNDAMQVYDLAQRKYDPWPETPPEEGTSVRAGAMAMRELGLWSGFVMGYGDAEQAVDLVTIARFILNVGPVMAGISWREGYDRPRADDGFIWHEEGQDRGGHNIAWDGVRYTGNPERDYFRVHQTWGHDYGFRAYGHGGFARVPWLLAEKIAREPHTTFCSPVEV